MLVPFDLQGSASERSCQLVVSNLKPSAGPTAPRLSGAAELPRRKESEDCGPPINVSSAEHIAWTCQTILHVAAVGWSIVIFSFATTAACWLESSKEHLSSATAARLSSRLQRLPLLEQFESLIAALQLLQSLGTRSQPIHLRLETHLV